MYRRYTHRGEKRKRFPPGSEVEITFPFMSRRVTGFLKPRISRLEEVAREAISGVSRRRVPLNVRAVAHLGEPLLLEGWDEDGFH